VITILHPGGEGVCGYPTECTSLQIHSNVSIFWTALCCHIITPSSNATVTIYGFTLPRSQQSHSLCNSGNFDTGLEQKCWDLNRFHFPLSLPPFPFPFSYFSVSCFPGPISHHSLHNKMTPAYVWLRSDSRLHYTCERRRSQNFVVTMHLVNRLEILLHLFISLIFDQLQPSLGTNANPSASIWIDPFITINRLTSNEYPRRKYFELLWIENYENSRLNSSRLHQRIIQIRIEYNISKNVAHWLRQWLKPHQATHYHQDNPANATSLFPDNVGSHNIVPDNLCNGSIILADNPWRPSHYPSGMVAL